MINNKIEQDCHELLFVVTFIARGIQLFIVFSLLVLNSQIYHCLIITSAYLLFYFHRIPIVLHSVVFTQLSSILLLFYPLLSPSSLLQSHAFEMVISPCFLSFSSSHLSFSIPSFSFPCFPFSSPLFFSHTSFILLSILLLFSPLFSSHTSFISMKLGGTFRIRSGGNIVIQSFGS